MRRLFIACLSLANLCYLRVWKDLLIFPPEAAFYNEHPPLPTQYLAAVCDVLLLAILFFFVSLALRKAPTWIRSAWFTILIVLLASSIRGLSASRVPAFHGGLFQLVSPTAALVLALVILVAFYGLVHRFNARVARVGVSLATVFAPFAILTFAESAVRAVRSRDGSRVAVTASRLPAIPARRAVWIIFDELDYRLSFITRPASIRMPELDRLCTQALCASDALPPSDATAVSMPELIHGREVRFEQPISADRELLTFSDSAVAAFGSSPNVFSKARAAGFNTGLVGWYMPYCRTLNDSLTDCWSSPMETQQNSSGDTFAESLWLQPKSLLETPVYSLFGQSAVTLAHASGFRALLDHAKRQAGDATLGLILIHLNIPHPPYFYNLRTGKFDLANSRDGYPDALALVDQAFGELRAAMETAGTWDRTTVLVSADHWLRSAPVIDHRVPFLLHLARDEQAIAYDREFGTSLTGDLLLAALSGELKTNAEAADWITLAAGRSRPSKPMPTPTARR